MAVRNIALLAALLPAVLAIPQHGALYSYHASHRGSKPPGGWPHPTAGPFHSGQLPFPPKPSGGAPFPAGNSTAGGATATGTGMVTIKSTINLIPVPLTASTPVVGQSPATTGAVAGGPGGPGQSGSPGSPSGVPGGSGLPGGTCGPATVTVTTANTVTVTVQASASPSLIESPQYSAPVQSSVAPYPMYNSSVPLGPTATGTGSLFTSYVAPTPSTSSSASSSAGPKIVQEASDGQVFVPATSIEAGAAATTSSLVAVNADYHYPGHPGPHSSSAAPEQPSAVVPAPASSSSVSSAVPSPASSPVDSPVSTALSAPASSSSTSTSGSSGSTGVKARGLLYSYNNQQLSPAESLAQANAAVNGAVGWMANWDSSPSTGSGQATGSGNVPYVAQLWGTDATHLAAWKTNAVTSWLMGFNEPDRCDDGGSCLSPTEAAAAHTANIAPLRTGGTKVTTPCTQNNVGTANIGSEWMANFTAQFETNSFDAICFHWYGPGTQEGLNGADNPQSLAATVAAYQDIQKANGIAELWITEGGPEDAGDMIPTFLAWLDDESNGIDRYLWNGLNSPTSVVAVGSGSTYLST